MHKQKAAEMEPKLVQSMVGRLQSSVPQLGSAAEGNGEAMRLSPPVVAPQAGSMTNEKCPSPTSAWMIKAGGHNKNPNHVGQHHK